MTVSRETPELTRFIELSCVMREELMGQWPAPTFDEWSDALARLMEALACQEHQEAVSL